MLGSSSLLMLPKPVLLDSRCRCLLVAMSVLVQADGAVLIVVDDLKDTPPRLASVTPDRPDKAKRPKLESGTPDGASTKLESAVPDGASPSSSHLSPESKEVMRREALGPLWAAPRDDPPVVPDWSAMSISPEMRRPSVSKEVPRHGTLEPTPLVHHPGLVSADWTAMPESPEIRRPSVPKEKVTGRQPSVP